VPCPCPARIPIPVSTSSSITQDSRGRGGAHRIVEVSVFLQVPDPSIDDGSRSPAGFGPGRHQASVAGVGDPGRTGDKHHGPFGHGVDVVDGMFGCRVLFGGVLDRVCRTDDLGCAILPLRGPHGQAGEKPAVGEV
jgi:hypothetical protein